MLIKNGHGNYHSAKQPTSRLWGYVYYCTLDHVAIKIKSQTHFFTLPQGDGCQIRIFLLRIMAHISSQVLP